jgi:hypothetical protein
LGRSHDVKRVSTLLSIGWVVALATTACGHSTRADAMAQGAAGTRTVTGQVVCLVCYARNKANTGADHDSGRMCAHACIKWEGNPAGVVATDGKVYQLAGSIVANNNAGVLPHVAHAVSVTGEVYEKDGMTMIRADELKKAQ